MMWNRTTLVVCHPLHMPWIHDVSRMHDVATSYPAQTHPVVCAGKGVPREGEDMGVDVRAWAYLANGETLLLPSTSHPSKGRTCTDMGGF